MLENLSVWHGGGKGVGMVKVEGHRMRNGEETPMEGDMSRRCLHKQSYQFYTRQSPPIHHPAPHIHIPITVSPAQHFPAEGLPKWLG